jgi:hypothetical protein
MARAMVRFLGFFPPVVIAFALTSCGLKNDQFAPACPVPGLVKPLSELARFRPGSQDIRDLVVRARIVDITGKCEPGDDPNRQVVTTVQVVTEVARGPAMQGQEYDLPVFVAVTDSTTGAILDKTLFYMPIDFQRNVDLARATSKEVRMEIPVSPRKSGAAYGIVAGFQLTPDEVAAWRRNNER